jgi:hypothetical protein
MMRKQGYAQQGANHGNAIAVHVDFSAGYPSFIAFDGVTTASFSDHKKTAFMDEDADFRLSIGLRWANFDKNGHLTSHGSGSFVTPSEAELAGLSSLAKGVASHLKAREVKERVFIRFGNLPRGGRSRNHATGHLEAGVSVFPAEYNRITGEFYFEEGTGIRSDAHMSYTLCGVTPTAVTGDVVGTGSDNEPLLANVKKLGKFKRTENGFTLNGQPAPVAEGALPWTRDARGTPTCIEAPENGYENLTDDEELTPPRP